MSHIEYSKWKLLDRIYTAKKAYYGSGKAHITDLQYDSLEGSFIALHGVEALKTWTCVGYDSNKHSTIKSKLEEIK